MKLQNVRRIIIEDYPKEQQELISNLAIILNSFMEDVVSLSNKRVDFDNLAQEIITLNVIVDASGIPTKETKFSTTTLTNCQGGYVIYCRNLSNPNIFPTSSPFVSFTSISDKLFRVNHITGLQSGSEYEIKVIVIKK